MKALGQQRQHEPQRNEHKHVTAHDGYCNRPPPAGLRCIGCGLCVSICPEVFEIGDDGLAQPIQEVTETLEKTASQARESCPVNAIDLE